MEEEIIEIPAQAKAVLDILSSFCKNSLRAVYLHGSAVSGGLQHQSDIDLLVVVDHPIPERLRKNLLSALSRISGRHPAHPCGPRCIEVMIFLESSIVTPKFPAQAEFVYGEWLWDSFQTGEIPMPVSDPEITLVLAQARQEAYPMFGPAAFELLPEIPPEHVRRAMRIALPALLDDLYGDERNVLLTFARMWQTAVTGKFVTKDAAAVWAIPRLPERVADVLAYAREAYLGKIKEDWADRQADARQAAEHLRQRVAAHL